MVAEAADGGEEGDRNDDRGDDGGDVRVRGPLVRRVQAGVRAVACNQGLHRLLYHCYIIRTKTKRAEKVDNT